MTFDKPEHKEMTLELIKRSTIPGHLIEQWAVFQAVVQSAEIAETGRDQPSQ